MHAACLFPFGRKSPGLLTVSYGTTEKTDQKFREKTLIFHCLAGNPASREKKDRKQRVCDLFS
jgi:hypothetical protein